MIHSIPSALIQCAERPRKSNYHITPGRAASTASPRQSPKNTSAARAAAQSKLDRKNHARQAQAAKRSSLVSATRVFAGVDGAPRIVAVIPLAPDVDAKNAAKGLAGAVGVEDEGSESIWKIRYVGILLRVDNYAQ